jgi:hypothetical protein
MVMELSNIVPGLVDPNAIGSNSLPFLLDLANKAYTGDIDSVKTYMDTEELNNNVVQGVQKIIDETKAAYAKNKPSSEIETARDKAVQGVVNGFMRKNGLPRT